MQYTLLLYFVNLYKKINQNLQSIFQINHLKQKKFFTFLLCLTIGFILTSLSTTTLWTVSGSPTTKYKTSWIGNTFGGGDKWVQNNIEAMYVAPNGTVYTNSVWDEAGREAGIYKDGNPVGMLEDLHGWNRLGGKAVTVNSKYIYIAMSQGAVDNKNKDYPPNGKTWYCIRRYHLSGKPAPFTNGNGWDKSMLIVSTKGEVTGLATREKELYVSDFSANLIRVFHTETMKEIRSFTVAKPGAIAIDQQGSLWIIQSKNGSNPAKILHYAQTGKQLPQQITKIVKPTAIAIDRQDRLLVTENGPRQQVLIYNITADPVQVATFGDKGGIYAGVPGEVQDLKLYGLTGVGTDATGNIYINSNGFNKSGTDLRKFSPSGKQLWRLLGLFFIDNADADPKTDGIDIFTKQEHFLMDYNQPPGKKWTYKNYTLNPFKYPQDPRLHTSPDATFVRRIKGKPFLFLTNMYSSFLQIYRFDSAKNSKIAIPSGMFVGTDGRGGKSIGGNWPPQQPEKGEWIWRDRNGNGAFEKGEYDRSEDYPYLGGWWVDSKGDVWKTLRTKDGIRHYPVQGLDANGNPIYTYSSMQKHPTPSMITDLRRIEYFPATDTMYLSGFTVDHPANGDDTGVVGSEIIRFDNWSQRKYIPHWRIVVPYDKTGKREVSTAAMSVAGDYVFAVTVKTAEVYVYNATTGAEVQKLKPGPEVAGESGWIDIPHGIRAFRRSNGEYVVFVEEDWKGKVIMYRLKG
ncbi:NHL repeat-containing protein [Calothrix sp. PCC 7507]|uniref:NHL repeat-containing protein n=1 Tax=Calothrix sp. PCC 7507 TaxID=99598 RepID=UPI00029F16E4|nr:NHL repeat-containing protein [Calothrix sp. PCC 7507]AFY34953.1 NHL repeat-containing protein [Calothrix sp. PCC 7507]